MSLYPHISISENVKVHQELIAKLRDKCSEFIKLKPDEFNDDLFLLRFCLSAKGDEEKAQTAVKTACEWRYKHRDLLARLRAGEEHPDVVELIKYSPISCHKQLKDGSPILLVRNGIADASMAVEKLGEEKLKNAIIFQKEGIYSLVDAESRKQNRIVKMVSFNDMQGASLSDFNRTFMKILGDASKELELVYPQLLGTSVVVHPPWFISIVWKIAQLVMPATTLEKVRFCKGNFGEDVKKCPVASRVINLDELPSYLGGKCECRKTLGCIPGIPNNTHGKVTGKEADAFAKEGIHLMRVSVKLHLKPKDYPFRCRILVNGLALSTEAPNGSPLTKTANLEVEEGEYILSTTPKQKVDKELPSVELGPFLPEKNTEEEISISLLIEKLVDGKNPLKSQVSDTKEKKETLEVNPFKTLKDKSLSFGDTADVVVSIEPFNFKPSSSPIIKKNATAATAAASESDNVSSFEKANEKKEETKN